MTSRFTAGAAASTPPPHTLSSTRQRWAVNVRLAQRQTHAQRQILAWRTVELMLHDPGSTAVARGKAFDTQSVPIRYGGYDHLELGSLREPPSDDTAIREVESVRVQCGEGAMEHGVQAVAVHRAVALALP